MEIILNGLVEELKTLGVNQTTVANSSKTKISSFKDSVDEMIYETFSTGYVRGTKKEIETGIAYRPVQAQVMNRRLTTGDKAPILLFTEEERLERVVELVKYKRGKAEPKV